MSVTLFSMNAIDRDVWLAKEISCWMRGPGVNAFESHEIMSVSIEQPYGLGKLGDMPCQSLNEKVVAEQADAVRRLETCPHTSIKEQQNSLRLMALRLGERIIRCSPQPLGACPAWLLLAVRDCFSILLQYSPHPLGAHPAWFLPNLAPLENANPHRRRFSVLQA